MRIHSGILLTILLGLNGLEVKATNPGSVFTQRPDDPEACYFTPENYDIRADGRTDVSDALQSAINHLKNEKNFGILFMPEGRYLISKTIYIPPAVRLIGYGKNRPVIILGKNSPGYQTNPASADIVEKYLIWFTGSAMAPGREPQDANPGTFYSAISNIDFRIEDGNPIAVALRTHYAQHGFVSHSIIHIGQGRAGISDVGNEIENVQFIGGDYGIVTGPTSPSWPMMMTETYFEGQRKAAIHSYNSGLTIIRMYVKNVPVVMEVEEKEIDRLFLEDCLFENVSKAGILIDARPSTLKQINVVNTGCINVPVWVKFRDNGNSIKSTGKYYKVKEFVFGLTMKDLSDSSGFNTISEIEILITKPALPASDIASLPSGESWVNIKSLGAIGDGEADDTEIFRLAISKHKVIYVPQGWYRLTETLKMSPGTVLIGLHPWATQFILKESEPAFSGFGGPIPVIESSEGGNDIISGIGISTGGYNYRAVGCKWMAGERSLMNDVKFAGGHGSMRRPEPGEPTDRPYVRPPRQISSPSNPVNQQGPDLAWDNQHWSLWITNNGGGVFKDIWTANTYATSGLLVSNTQTPGRIYAMSLEHHVRNEVRFDNVSNWKIYAFQLEEESREGKECQMVEIVNSKDILFANLWIYRVIRVTTPKRFGVRLWNCSDIDIRNLHNYTQKLWVTEFPLWDMNKELPCYPWELAKLTVTGDEARQWLSVTSANTPLRLVSGFDFAQGITSDSKGNVYFCETRRKRIYKWSAQTGSASLVADFPFEPLALACDSKDNLLVVCRYDPQPGYMINGMQEIVKRLPDDNPAYSSYGNSGWAAYCYSIDPDDPDESFLPMPRVATADIDSFRKTYYPSSRWHYTFDQAAAYYPDSAFMAPDGITYIQETYDIGRCAALSPAVAGGNVYASDEIGKRTVRMIAGERGRLSYPEEVLPRGETSNITDSEGNLYIADGQIFVYDKNLKEVSRISLPERPVSMAIGGKDKDTLFITSLTSLYSVKINSR
jgi:hypothetical protein